MARGNKFTGIRYLSFDCYGTLIDWENGILSTLSSLFDQYQSIPQVDVLASFAKWEAAIESGEFLNYHDVLVKVLDGMCSDYRIGNTRPDLLAQSVTDWKPFSDSAANLHLLQKYFGLVVLSNVDMAMFAETTKALDTKFDLVCTAEEIGSYKPSLENFEYMMFKLNCEPTEVLHVAQSLYHDHVPAKQLGLQTVWVNRPSIAPGQGVALPAEVRPDFTVSNMQELTDLILSVA